MKKRTRRKKDVTRDQYIGARFTAAEKKAFDERVKKLGSGKSKLIRWLLLSGAME